MGIYCGDPHQTAEDLCEVMKINGASFSISPLLTFDDFVTQNKPKHRDKLRFLSTGSVHWRHHVDQTSEDLSIN